MSTTTDENTSDKGDGGRLSRESSLGSNSLVPPVRRPTTRRSVRDLHDDGIEQLSSPPTRTKHTPTTKPSSPKQHSRIYCERNQEARSSFASVNSGLRSIGASSLYPELYANDSKPSSSSHRRHSSEDEQFNMMKPTATLVCV